MIQLLSNTAAGKRLFSRCLLVALLCLLGSVLLFSSPLTAHASPLSLHPHRTGEGPCTLLQDASLSISVMEGTIGKFTLKNTCPNTIYGTLTVVGYILHCVYGASQDSDWKRFLYLIGPDAEQIFRFQVLASCIKCDCKFGDSSRSRGFDLDIIAYNAEGGLEIADPPPFDLYVGPDPGGLFQVGSCGESIEVASLNRVS